MSILGELTLRVSRNPSQADQCQRISLCQKSWSDPLHKLSRLGSSSAGKRKIGQNAPLRLVQGKCLCELSCFRCDFTAESTDRLAVSGTRKGSEIALQSSRLTTRKIVRGGDKLEINSLNYIMRFALINAHEEAAIELGKKPQFEMSKVYYHFTTWQMNLIVVGQQYEANWEVSNYWKCKLDGSFLIDFEPFRGLTKWMLNVLNGLHKADLEEIRRFLLHAKYSSELLKEYIFEEIRTSEFPQVPSRMRCLFLFEAEHDKDAEVYLQKMGYSLTGRSLIKVEPVDGKSATHRTDAKLLDVNLSKQPEVAAAARKYWQGTSDPVELPEVLLEGSFVISEIVRNF